jgi:polysaccharide export outer membrane protein
VCAQGLTVDELKAEVDARYEATIPGVDVTPVITQRAARFAFVLGEVKTPGRYTLEGPTTLMGAIAMAGGWNIGANLRQVVVFRRGDDWRLLATMLDVNGALYGRRPVPADEIWLNDSDIIVVPKTPITVADEFINQFFTNGLYSAFPQFSFGNFNFNNFRSISN